MEQRFEIPGRLGSLNDYILKCRANPHTGNNYKHSQQGLIIEYIRDLQRVECYPLEISFYFYEKNAKRDIDNVAGWAHKCILDALVKAGIIENDGWKQIRSIRDYFEIDRENPRIVVILKERGDRDEEED